jgi:hypothetical protein
VRDFEGPLSIKAVVRGTGLWETPEGRFSVDRLRKAFEPTDLLGPASIPSLRW